MTKEREAFLALARSNLAMLRLDTRRFQGRLSNRVAEKLVAAGIDAPERLLFMSLKQISGIPGIGKAAIEDIKRYRARYLPAEGEGT